MQTTQQNNFSIDISDEFCFSSMRDKEYKIPSEEVINDLQKCFLVVDKTPEVFVLKDYDSLNKMNKISYTSEYHAKAKLKKLFVGYSFENNKRKKISAWDIYIDNTARFTVKGSMFYSEEKHTFSFFRGYKYSVLESVKKELIQPWLNHVRDVIANGDEKIYTYLLAWIAAVLQRPAFKTGVAIVILGEQGAGKNTFFTDVICRLMAQYANSNVTNIESIVGKFNAIIENKKITICNELRSVYANKFFNSDVLKSLITDPFININQKNEPERIAENVSNFMFVSNNNVPVQIDNNDRRYCVTNVSSAHLKDFNYFAALDNSFTAEFYDNLFTYFMKMDISKINLRDIPNTEARQTIIDASMSSYESFVLAYYKSLVNVSGMEMYELYQNYAKDNNFQICSSRTFIANVKPFTGPSKAKRFPGEDKPRQVYNLKPEVIERCKQNDEILMGDEELEESDLGVIRDSV